MIFFGSEARWIAKITLIVQIVGFVALSLGFIYAKRKKFLKHDSTAKISILLGGLSLMWMMFSLVSYVLPLISMTYTGFIIFFHTTTGLLAFSMGLLLVLGEIKKTKISMVITFSSWTAAMLLGIMLFFILHKD